MPEYLSPGVYVEEIDAGPKPIEGVSTSTAGAVGVTAMGPTEGKPVLVTSFTEFVRKFGGYLKEPNPATRLRWDDPASEGGHWWYFPLSVKGFFDNGGQRLYVKRVFSRDAVASEGDLGKGLVAEVVADTASGATTIRLSHLFDVMEGTGVTFFRGDTGAQVGGPAASPVTAYDSGTNTITLGAGTAAALSRKRGDFVEIHARSASPIPDAEKTLTFSARSPGEWGDALRLKVRPTAAATLNLLPNAADPANLAFSAALSAKSATNGGTTITLDDVSGLADGDTVLVRGAEYTLSNKVVAAKTFKITPTLPAGVEWEVGTSVKRLRKASGPAGSDVLNIRGGDLLYAGAVVELDNGREKERLVVASVVADVVTFAAAPTRTYLEGHRARVIEAEVIIQYAPGGVIEAEELFSPLRLKDDGTLNYLVNYVNERSTYVKVEANAGFSDSDLANFPTDANGGWIKLAGGDNRFDRLDPSDFAGKDEGSGKRTGIAALEEIDEISICMAPNIWAPTVHSTLFIHCETLKDRFAIVDPPDGLDNEGIRSFREPINTKYAALYYPWLVVRDPGSRRVVHVAPSGHMAGIYARVDVERGVHKAPANEVVRGIGGFAADVTKREQDLLNPKNINALRYFPGRGNLVWGARVLTPDASWKYINVRRLFIYIEESLDEGLQWVVFEPNDEMLWSRVRQTITNFLTTEWRNGKLFGTKQPEAFFVKCDRTTMTQDDLDNGRLICLVGIAPVRPAEFVIIRIQQKTIEGTPA